MNGNIREVGKKGLKLDPSGAFVCEKPLVVQTFRMQFRSPVYTDFSRAEGWLPELAVGDLLQQVQRAFS